MNCFACGKPIINTAVACPHCGYRFSVDDDRTCPNSYFNKCNITGKLCHEGINYNMCEIKSKVDKESW